MKAIYPEPQKNSIEHITLQAFKAPDEPALCNEFLVEHRKVLEDFGISHVATNTDVWMHDPQCYVIVAMHEDLGMVGGIRLKLDYPGSPLPMASAIRKLDAKVDAALADLQPFGNGEVCGLWAAHRYLGKGVPAILSEAVTAISVMAGARRMVCFVAHYTQKYPAKNGFIVMDAVGENGYFPSYPIPRITGIAMVNPDTMLLEYASEAHRLSIYRLRLNPEQTRMEHAGDTAIEVKYRLRVNAQVRDLHAYQQIEALRRQMTA